MRFYGLGATVAGLEPPDTGPNPFQSLVRERPLLPMVGVGAVVFDLLDRVLLVKRGNPPHEDQWGLPGGW